jgi:hypothetical protein
MRGRAFLPGITAAFAIAMCGDAAAACRLRPLTGWSIRDVQWIGPCLSGVADGAGVLKHYDGGRLRESFFGAFKAGEAEIGVIDTAAGFVAGRFDRGVVIDTQDRNILIQAFDAAGKAARNAGDMFDRQGNAQSAAFYRLQAEKLARQME